MAGVVGFEPTIHGIKNRCLATWLHPNGAALITLSIRMAQGWKDKGALWGGPDDTMPRAVFVDKLDQIAHLRHCQSR